MKQKEIHFQQTTTLTPERYTTDIDVTVVREGKKIKGWFLGFVLRTIRRHVLENAFENSIKAIEARNSAARAA